MLGKILYFKDEDAVVIAKVDGYPEYYAQGDSYEDARLNLIDVIEIIIADRIQDRFLLLGCR